MDQYINNTMAKCLTQNSLHRFITVILRNNSFKLSTKQIISLVTINIFSSYPSEISLLIFLKTRS